MKTIVSVVLLLCSFVVGYGQGPSVVPLRGDTVKISKTGGYAELVLQNRTKDTLGMLVNYGNGKTKFMKSRKLNDSTIIIGLDTLNNIGGAGGTSSIGVDTLYSVNDTTIAYVLDGSTYQLEVGSGTGSILDIYKRPPIRGIGTIDNPLDTRVMVVNSLDSLRIVYPDTNWVYQTVTPQGIARFRYNPLNTTSADDSVMVIRNGAARFERQVDTWVNLEWFYKGEPYWRPAIIRAFNYFKNNSRSGTIYVPKGTHEIDSTVFFNFGTNITVNLIGDASGGRFSGSAFTWRGPSGLAMFRLQSTFMSRFENIDFNGRYGSGSAAKYIFHFEWVSGGLSSLMKFNTCSFLGAGGDSSALINMNATGGIGITANQVDETTFENCYFSGHPINSPDSLKTWWGVIMGGNNTKNFTFNRNHIINLTEDAIKGLSGLGQLTSFRNIVGGVKYHFNLNAATTLTSKSDYSESIGGILKVGTGSTAVSSFTLEQYENHSHNYDGALGPTFPLSLEEIISGQGNLILIGCTFNSGSRPVKIEWSTHNGIQSLTAINNNFYGVTSRGVTPFYSGGNPLFNMDREVDNNQSVMHRVFQAGNIGMDSTGLVAYRMNSGSTEDVFIRGQSKISAGIGIRPDTGYFQTGDIHINLLKGEGRAQVLRVICTRAGMYKVLSVAGTLTSGSPIVTGIASTAGIQVGDIVKTSAGYSNNDYPAFVSAVTPTTITLSNRPSEANTAVTITNIEPVFKAIDGAYGNNGERDALAAQLTSEDNGFPFFNTTTGTQEIWSGTAFSGGGLWALDSNSSAYSTVANYVGIGTDNINRAQEKLHVKDTTASEQFLRIEGASDHFYSLGVGKGGFYNDGEFIFGKGALTGSNWDWKRYAEGSLQFKTAVAVPTIYAPIDGVGLAPVINVVNTGGDRNIQFLSGWGSSLGVQDYHAIFGDVGSNFFVKTSSSAPLFTVRSDGNVGIHTTTPAYKLQVTAAYVDGQTIANIQLPSGVGSGYGLLTHGSRGGGIYNYILNQSDSSAAHAILALAVNSRNAGDPGVTMTTGTNTFTFGIDNSDNNKFKAAFGSSLPSGLVDRGYSIDTIGFMKYLAHLSFAAADSNTIVDKNYVDSLVAAGGGGGGSSQWTDIANGNIYFNDSTLIGATSGPRGMLDVRGTAWLGAPSATHGIVNSFDAMYFNVDAGNTAASRVFGFGFGRSTAGTGGTDIMNITSAGVTVPSVNTLFGGTSGGRGKVDVQNGSLYIGTPTVDYGIINADDGIRINAEADGGSSFRSIELAYGTTASSGGTSMALFNNTGVTLASLAGSGTRIVKASSAGLLSAGTIDTTDIATFATKVRSLFTAGSGITINQGIITSTSSGVNPIIKNTNVLTTQQIYSFRVLDTFYLRGIKGTAPLSFSQTDSAINGEIAVANTTTSGYITSTDWNTFNNKAATASPTFTGTPTAPTAAVGTNTTQIATTAYVHANLATVAFECGHLASSFNPADATTYYFGVPVKNNAPTTASVNRNFVIPFNATLVGYSLTTFHGASGGSQEDASFYVRKNNATDITLTTTAEWNVTFGVINAYSSMALNESFDAGDLFQIKLVTPTWATNPTLVDITVILYFRPRP